METKNLKGIEKKVYDMVKAEIAKLNVVTPEKSQTPTKTDSKHDKEIENVKLELEKLQKQLSEVKSTLVESQKTIDEQLAKVEEPVIATVETTDAPVSSYQSKSVSEQVLSVCDDIVTVRNDVHVYTTEELNEDDLKSFGLTTEGKYVFLLVKMPETMTLNKKHFKVTTTVKDHEDNIRAGFATLDDGVSALMAVPVNDKVILTTVTVYWNGTKDTGENVTTFKVSTIANSLATLLN